MPDRALYDKVQEVKKQLNRVIRGKEQVLQLLFAALFAEGHVLMEDVPGTGKTTLAKALALSVTADFSRIQFTPDLLPADILGSSIYSPKEGTFFFRQGPVFTNLLLADEINRASPRTQSALLEAMNERQVSIEGKELKLIKPFLVIATQNPIEYYGTYPLPEAQLDRFAIRLSLGYPDEESELQILKDRRGNDPLEALQPVLDCDEIRRIQEEVRTVEIEDSLADYMMQVIRATRESNEIRLGASPRALLMLSRCAQSMAWLDNRMFVKPDDILALIQPLLAHRLVMTLESKHAGVTPAMVLEEIVKKIRIPV
ncbi:MAG: AAA family ATPase [Victivallales bacterium]